VIGRCFSTLVSRRRWPFSRLCLMITSCPNSDNIQNIRSRRTWGTTSWTGANQMRYRLADQWVKAIGVAITTVVLGFILYCLLLSSYRYMYLPKIYGWRFIFFSYYIVIVCPTLPVRRFKILFFAFAVFTFNLYVEDFYRVYVCVHIIFKYHGMFVDCSVYISQRSWQAGSKKIIVLCLQVFGACMNSKLLSVRVRQWCQPGRWFWRVSVNHFNNNNINT